MSAQRATIILLLCALVTTTSPFWLPWSDGPPPSELQMPSDWLEDTAMESDSAELPSTDATDSSGGSDDEDVLDQPCPIGYRRCGYSCCRLWPLRSVLSKAGALRFVVRYVEQD